MEPQLIEICKVVIVMFLAPCFIFILISIVCVVIRKYCHNSNYENTSQMDASKHSECEDCKCDEKIKYFLQDLHKHKINCREQLEDLMDMFDEIGVETREELERLLGGTEQDITALTDEQCTKSHEELAVSEHKKESIDSVEDTLQNIQNDYTDESAENKMLPHLSMYDRPKYAKRNSISATSKRASNARKAPRK